MAGNQEQGFAAIRENDATSEIRSGLLTFGEDVLRTKFPSFMDGLKDITRRILWFSRDVRDPQGLGKAMGNVCEYHVSGDSSVYEAFVRLGQPFMMGHRLLIIHGNFGNSYNPKGAAQVRYLEVQMSEFSRDLFFTGTHVRTIPMVPTKTFGEMEPRYMIPKLPTALFFGNLTVGFGFKSHFPMLDFADVCDLVMMFSEHYQKGGVGMPSFRAMSKHMVPAFPIRTVIRNRPELVGGYAKGEFQNPLDVEGWVDISGNSIVLRSVPYGTDFSTVTKALREQLRDRKHWLWNYLVAVNQYSSDEAEFSIEFKRGLNPFKVLDILRPILKLTNRWHPIYSYMKDGRAINLSPAALIYLWYQERAICIAGGLKYRQADLIQNKMMLEAMLVICEHSNEVIELIKNSDDENQAIDRLYARFEQLTWKQAKIIAHQRISTLAKSNRKQIETDLEQTMQDIDATTASFSRIHETMYSDAALLKKKYGPTRESKFAEDFIGYVQFGNLGVVHFFNTDEMYDILNTRGWPGNVQRTIHMYNAKTPVRYLVRSGKFVPLEVMSKEITCEGIVCYPSEKADLTLVIDTSDGSTAITDRVIDGVNDAFIICPITRVFHAIHRNGSITREDISAYSVRKTVSKGARTDLIYGLQDNVRDVVVFHMNTSETNVIRADRILREDSAGSCKTVPTGKTIILGIYPIRTKELYLNIPEPCRKNVAAEHVLVRSVEQLFSNKQNHRLFNIGKTASGVKFKRNGSVRTLFTLEVAEK